MKKYLLISIALVLLFSCKKEEAINLHKYAGLPDATQSGENTMGCLMNGIPWAANVDGIIGWPSLEKVNCFYGEPRENISEYDKFYLNLACYRYIGSIPGGYSTEQSLHFRIQPVFNTGNLIKNSKVFDIYYNDGSFNGLNKSYTIDTTKNISILINNLDTTKNVIAGLFDLILVRKYFTYLDYNDTIRITNGRFDANYWPK